MSALSLKILAVLSVVLKVYAFLTFFLMSVGVVGILKAGDVLGPQRFQILLNMLLGGSLFFLVLYTLSELVRLLLTLETRTRKYSI